MSKKLYETCPGCRDGVTEEDHICPMCNGVGFIETGATIGQLERAARDVERYYTQRCELKEALIPFVLWMGWLKDHDVQVGNFEMGHVDRGRRALRAVGWSDPSDISRLVIPKFQPKSESEPP